MRTSSHAWRNRSSDRCWLPVCTIRLFFRAAFTIARPSAIVSVSGFSQYTSLPASQASIVIRACQWSGVVMTTASTSFRSSSLR